jgi:hypothetical protein
MKREKIVRAGHLSASDMIWGNIRGIHGTCHGEASAKSLCISMHK